MTPASWLLVISTLRLLLSGLQERIDSEPIEKDLVLSPESEATASTCSVEVPKRGERPRAAAGKVFKSGQLCQHAGLLSEIQGRGSETSPQASSGSSKSLESCLKKIVSCRS